MIHCLWIMINLNLFLRNNDLLDLGRVRNSVW